MKVRLAAAALALASVFTVSALPANAVEAPAVAQQSAVVATEGDSTSNFFCFLRIRIFCHRLYR